MLRVIASPYLLSGGALYGAATLVWIWLLSKMPLSQAYPFMALGFVLVPLASAYFFGEQLHLKYWAGMACIIGGILLTLNASTQ